MWKFQDFSVIQILREIKIGESRNPKTTVIAIFEALDFVSLVNFSLQKVLTNHKYQNSEPLNVFKWQILHFKNLEN